MRPPNTLSTFLFLGFFATGVAGGLALADETETAPVESASADPTTEKKTPVVEPTSTQAPEPQAQEPEPKPAKPAAKPKPKMIRKGGAVKAYLKQLRPDFNGEIKHSAWDIG